ncbi:MAG TPA: FtsH protease activity modulator HflK [Nevskiales bacterium]|nr:FtsH protease activity modulator HflK [Nevskiales bacterium]
MGWNEPGNGKDPWSRSSRGPRPPDFETLLRRLRGGIGGGPGREGRFSALAIAAAVGVIWILSGMYIIQPAERGVVLQFGKHVATTGPGPHWHLPYPIQRVEKVNVDQVQSLSDRAVMLTQDENIVSVELAVQYRVSDAENYLFRLRDPEFTLREAMLSAVREVVGKSKVDFVLSEGRVEVAQQTQNILQDRLDAYASGLLVTTLTLQDVQPPDPVQPAFDDVTRSREDEVKKKNEAEAYANAILPIARGEAARQIAEAEAYRSRVVERAKGEADRFVALSAEYERAPQVTRKRLYLDAMESVLANTSKIVVDSDSGNQLLYLPVDQLMRQAPAAPADDAAAQVPAPAARPAPAAPANDYRGRGR